MVNAPIVLRANHHTMKNFTTLILLLFCFVGHQTLGSPKRFGKKKSYQLTAHEITIPLERYANLFFVKVQIDGQEHRMMLDFGAQDVVLDKSKFPDMEYYPMEFASINQLDVPGGRSRVEELKLGSLVFEKRIVYVMPMHFSKKMKSLDFSGVIGVSLFDEFEIELDLAKQLLRLFQVDKYGERLTNQYALNDQSAYSIPFSYANNIMLVEGEIEGKKVRFGLDTGAEISVMDASMNKKVKSALKLSTKVFASGAQGKTKVVESGQIPSVLFNDVLAIEYLQTIVLPLSGIEDAYGISLDGLLGFDFFAKGKFTFNFVKRELTIHPHEEQYYFCDPVI